MNEIKNFFKSNKESTLSFLNIKVSNCNVMITLYTLIMIIFAYLLSSMQQACGGWAVNYELPLWMLTGNAHYNA